MKELKQIRESPSVAFWLAKAARSPRTEYLYSHTIAKYTNENCLDLEAIVSEWRNIKYDYAERERFLDKHAEIVERYAVGKLAKLTPNARKTELIAILSFYRHNKIPLEADIKEKTYVVNHNRAIKKEEVVRILKHASPRDECFFLMMLESGLRPQTLCLLRWRHIKTDFIANRIPMKIDLEASMLKDNVGNRFTFIGEDGFRALKEYLAPKLPLHDNDVVFTAVHSSLQKGETLFPSLFSTQFGNIVKTLGLANKKSLQRFRNELNLYTLRKYFRNNMKVSDPAYREFWMGHSLGVDRHYFHADVTDPATVEKHRAEYAKGYPYLRVLEESVSEGTKNKIEKLEQENKELKSKIDEMMKGWESLKPLVDAMESQEVVKAVQNYRREKIEKQVSQLDKEAYEEESESRAEVKHKLKTDKGFREETERDAKRAVEEAKKTRNK
jgi:integrase